MEIYVDISHHGKYPRHHCSYTPAAVAYKLNYFPKFVSRVLFHLNTSTIQEFTLRISESYDPYYINQWISAALNRWLKRIYVYSEYGQYNLSSYPLFESHSLEELVFRMRPSCIIKLPAVVCLPSLTVLKFTGITFTCYSSNEWKEFTLNFPLLREFETYNCIWSGIESITIEAPLLELVKMVKSEYEIIKFCASHIKKFSCGTPISSHRSSQTILLDEQHIPFAKLHVFVNNYNGTSVEEIRIFLRKLLRLFVNTEFLHLRLPHHKKSLALGEHYLARVPAFRMLVHLHLHIVTCDVLLDFPLKSPCLKTLGLVIQEKMAADYEEEESQDFAIVPDCFLSTLEVVEFGRYVGHECELSFVKFVTENAKVLERISFSFAPHLSCSEVEKAKEKLSCLVKSTVIVEYFSYNH